MMDNVLVYRDCVQEVWVEKDSGSLRFLGKKAKDVFSADMNVVLPRNVMVAAIYAAMGHDGLPHAEDAEYSFGCPNNPEALEDEYGHLIHKVVVSDDDEILVGVLIGMKNVGLHFHVKKTAQDCVWPSNIFMKYIHVATGGDVYWPVLVEPWEDKYLQEQE